jgi:hypothetical protein
LLCAEVPPVGFAYSGECCATQQNKEHYFPMNVPLRRLRRG